MALFADDSDIVAVVKLVVPTLVLIAGGVVLWLQGKAAKNREEARAIRIRADAEALAFKVEQVKQKADEAAAKSDESHAVVKEIKELAVKTESQTNNRLSELDKTVTEMRAAVANHEKNCVEQKRLIAELKLMLSEALKSKTNP